MEQKRNRRIKICAAAGKSGGHIIPCLVLARQQHTTFEPILFFAHDTPLDKKLLANQKDIVVCYVPHSCQTRWFLVRAVSIVWMLIVSWINALIYLAYSQPDAVITTGGRIALPVCAAAWCVGIPFDLYELNAVPGKTIRLLSSYARTTYSCFSTVNKFLPRVVCIQTAYPFAQCLSFNKKINLDPSSCIPTLLILGGSQGSSFINQIMCQWWHEQRKTCSVRVIHQTGNADYERTKNLYGHKMTDDRVIIMPFSATMPDLYQQADLVICRAGAGTLFELCAHEKRAFIIPIEHLANNHQHANACAMAHHHPHLFTIFTQQEIHVDSSFFFAQVTQKLIKTVQ